MELHILSPLISFLIVLSLGCLIFFLGRRRGLASSFFIISLLLMTLNLSYTLCANPHISKQEAISWARLGVLGAGLLFPALFHLTLLITKNRSLIKRRCHYLVYLSMLLFIYVVILHIDDVMVYPWGYLPKPSIPLYILHLFTFLILISSLYLLWRGKKRLLSKRERIIAGHFLVGGILTGGISALNLLPFYGADVHLDGVVLSTLLLLFIAWVILRYRVAGMDVGVLKLPFLSSVVCGVVMGVFMLCVWGFIWIFKVKEPLFPAIVGSIAIAFLFPPLRGRIRDRLTRSTFVHLSHQVDTLKGFTKGLASIHERDELFTSLKGVLLKAFEVKDVYLLLEDKKGYAAVSGEFVFDPDPHLIRWLRERKALQDYELEDLRFSKDYEELIALFDGLGIMVLIPLTGKTKLIGFLGLGEKTSAQTYTKEEIDLLITLSGNVAIGLENIDLYKQMRRQILGAAKALAVAVEVKEAHNYGHGEEVSRYAKEIAARMGLSQARVEDIRTGAFLHDIGKIGIPDGILKKPMELSEDEWNQIHQHPKRGYEIISPIQLGEDVVDAVRYHHERFDGKGYPYGLIGDRIPISGRITAVANAYVSMLEDRPYRSGLSKKEALLHIKDGAGELFDPKVVEILEELVGDM
jgi:putative nucleotidyltransferase with HDIG domain